MAEMKRCKVARAARSRAWIGWADVRDMGNSAASVWRLYR